VLDCEADTIVLNAGTRWGKTQVAAYRALKTLLTTDKHIWVVAPSYELTGKVFGWVERWLANGFPSLVSGISRRPIPRIITPWNSWLEGKSSENPTGLLGEELDLLIIDEASRIGRDIWDSYLFGRLTSRMGKSILISTPFGKNWFYEKWIEAKKDNAAFHFTSKDNPYFPGEKWEEARKKLPEQVFKQEYLAQFLEDAASVFRGIRAIISDDCLEDVRKDHKYCLGVDLGRHEDFTVLTIIDKYTHKVVFLDRFKKIWWPLQKERIIASAKRYNNARIIIDSTGIGEAVADEIKSAGLLVDDFKFSGQSKHKPIDKLSVYIEQKAITIPPDQTLIDELESYGYQISESGNIKYSAPQGLHDDCVISLALAVWGLTSPKTKKPETIFREMLFQGRKKTKFQYL